MVASAKLAAWIFRALFFGAAAVAALFLYSADPIPAEKTIAKLFD